MQFFLESLMFSLIYISNLLGACFERAINSSRLQNKLSVSIFMFFTPLLLFLKYMIYGVYSDYLVYFMCVGQLLYYSIDLPFAVALKDYVSISHHLIGGLLFLLGLIKYEVCCVLIPTVIFLEQGCVTPIATILLMNYNPALKDSEYQNILNVYNYYFNQVVLCLKGLVYIWGVYIIYVNGSGLFFASCSAGAFVCQFMWNRHVFLKYKVSLEKKGILKDSKKDD
jgi:hypothetical protein